MKKIVCYPLPQPLLFQVEVQCKAEATRAFNMIKLVAMSLFIVIGVVIGLLFQRFIASYKPNYILSAPLCIGLGIIGSFAGILLADIADLRLIGNVIDSIIFASIGSTLLLTLNLLVRSNSKSNDE